MIIINCKYRTPQKRLLLNSKGKQYHEKQRVELTMTIVRIKKHLASATTKDVDDGHGLHCLTEADLETEHMDITPASSQSLKLELHDFDPRLPRGDDDLAAVIDAPLADIHAVAEEAADLQAIADNTKAFSKGHAIVSELRASFKQRCVDRYALAQRRETTRSLHAVTHPDNAQKRYYSYVAAAAAHCRSSGITMAVAEAFMYPRAPILYKQQQQQKQGLLQWAAISSTALPSAAPAGSTHQRETAMPGMIATRPRPLVLSHRNSGTIARHLTGWIGWMVSRRRG